MRKNAFLFLLLAFACSGTLLAQASIFFEIRNERTVTHPTLGAADAIDLYMHASLTGTFHSRGQIYLSYNTNRFGQGVHASGNVAYEHADLLAGELIFLGDTTPKYATINVIDNGIDKVVFTWQSNFLSFTPNPLVHNEVPDTATHLYTIYVKVAANGQPSRLALDANLMRGQQFMITNNGGIPTEVAYTDGFLPVEMLSFQADKFGDENVMLTWETAKELNNDKFVIEKKRDEGEFEAIGEVKGAGTTDDVQHYTFLDKTGLAEQNYYRLRQVDIDGSITYSDIVEVGFDAYANDRFVVYPSPATDHTYLKAISELDGDYRVSVLDLTGKKVKELTFTKDTPTSGMRIDLSGISDGMYFVRTVSPLGTAYINRVLKVEQR